MDRKEFFATATRALRVEAVALPDGKTVHVRELTARERDEFEAGCTTTNRRGKVDVNIANVRARLVVASLCDAAGKRILDDADVRMVGDLPASIIDPIFAAAAAISGLSKQDAEELAGKA